MRRPEVKRLEAPLWEMRMTGPRRHIASDLRGRFGQRVVVLRVFVKKTEKTPRSEIEIALRRAKEIQ
jgi:phage-related protein